MSKKISSSPRSNIFFISLSIENKEYIKNMNSYMNSPINLKSLLDSPIFKQNFAQILIFAIKFRIIIQQLYDSFSALAYCVYYTNTTYTSYINKFFDVQNLDLILKANRSFLQKFLTINASLLISFYTSYPQYEI
ncbi:MAG: hypothetical protein BKP49_06195 [Treponema sp. CETP13]|nr:MAG: hypothetical protein BKP49_06195 [Treponema sp. CETP13]